MGDVHNASYYGKCMIGGILSCGLTHTVVVPLDIIKCRRQVDYNIYKSLGDGFKVIRAAEGIKGLTVGWVPTLIGYSCQGLGKFGFYEMFKDVYKKIVGEENAIKYQTAGFLIASACAEFIADTLLCPWESLKVRTQVDFTGTFPRNPVTGFNLILKNEGANGFYKGLSPLWMRQIPYTMVKFAMFEKTVRYVYANFLTKDKSEYSKATKLTVTFLSGYWAGIFCAIVSHPADTVVSKLNQASSEGSTVTKIKSILGELGFKGIWRGLSTRILMIGTLTGLQWWIYDSFKTAIGLQATGTDDKKVAK
jgi:solute carrier family 25 phosphate transporter 3